MKFDFSSDLYLLYLLKLLAPPRAALLVNMENIASCIPVWALLVAIYCFGPRSDLVLALFLAAANCPEGPTLQFLLL